MAVTVWENKLINDYIYVSRFIASWYNAGGTSDKWLFKKWLDSLIGLSEDDKHIILYQFGNGKLELELSAEDFIMKHSIKEES